MTRLFRSSSALLVAIMLAGCGSHVGTPPTATSLAALNLHAQAVVPADTSVKTLISSYKAITGYDAAAMTRRATIVAQLGDTDSDDAANFISAEYEKLSDFPIEVRDDYSNKLLDALLSLDTYESNVDDPAVAAGAGASLIQMQTYFDASLRQRRHHTFTHWVSTPFRWVGNGFKHFWQGLTGHTPKRKRRPSPGGGSGNIPSGYPTNTPPSGGTGGTSNSYPF